MPGKTALKKLPGNRHGNWLSWVGILCLAVFLLWFRMDHESLGFDESYTLAAVKWPLGDMISMIGKDSHPPLYFIGLKSFTALFGVSPVSGRSWSALWSLLLVGLGFFPLRKWWGERRGKLYSLVCLFFPMTVIMGQEARMYTQAAFFVTLAFILCHRIWARTASAPTDAGGTDQASLPAGKARSPSWLYGAFALASIAAAYTHYYALMAVIVMWAGLLASLARRYARPDGSDDAAVCRCELAAGLVWGAICIAALSPWAVMMVNQASRIKLNYWIEAPNAGTVLDALMMPWNFKYGLAFPSFMLMPLAWALILGRTGRFVLSRIREAFLADARRVMAAGGSREALGAPGVQEDPKARAKKEIFQELVPGLGPAVVYLAVLIAALVISLCFRPILVQRYMVCCLGLIAMTLAWTLDRLMIFHPRRSKALLAVFITCGALVLSQVYLNRYSGSMTESVEWLETRIQPGDIFIHASEHTLGTFAWYFPDHQHYFYMKPGTVPYSNYEVFKNNCSWGSDLKPLLDQEQVIWFAWVEFQDFFLPLKTMLDDPRWTFASKIKSFGIDTSWYNPEYMGFRRTRPGEHSMDMMAIMKE